MGQEFSNNSSVLGAAAHPAPPVIDRIRAGDREAAAAFLTEHELLLRRRYRQKLGRALRRLVDSQEIVSTIARRLDRAVSRGGVKAENQSQFWSLIFRIGDNALADKARTLAQLRRAEEQETSRASHTADHGPAAPALYGRFRIEELAQRLPSDVDRRILARLAEGAALQDIATEVGMSPAAVRKRWERARQILREIELQPHTPNSTET